MLADEFARAVPSRFVCSLWEESFLMSIHTDQLVDSDVDDDVDADPSVAELADLSVFHGCVALSVTGRSWSWNANHGVCSR